ncbi:flagellar assembly protein FliH [Halopseudomonas oceani]|uniref:Flagellar assembly protein FliH n=1 Tax=Halopseudomonas oceani TaxID=1708783 RepID=A0A2P4EWJ7_9GAMM|nr:flagellar assembly protein FliH [Halopseudomonas oceani]POB04334.1 flagellar assembly protein FliH [Halopseudomonas oceani]GGE31535.1 flagellar assembly protein FliH [Halopseudomonas oceani]
MSQVKNESELLRSSEVSAFSRWDLPSFDAEPHQIALERETEPSSESAPDPQPEEEQELETVKPFTVEELEQIREEAYNEGFATGEKDGFHAGQLKGQQEAKAVLAKRTDELDALMVQLMAPLKKQDEQIEDMLLVLLEQMLRAVLQREMQSDRDQVMGVLRSALKALPVGAENIRIYLNPLDFDSIKALRERHEESWRLLEDDQLMPGGCRVETEHSQVDATLETRLQQLIEQLYEQRREQRAHPPEADLPIPDSASEQE